MKIAIIGAGVLGRLSALKMISLSHDITVFEADSFDQPHGAAAISAGLISPISESVHTTATAVKLGFDACAKWPGILKELRELDPLHAQIFYRQSGTFAVSFPEDEPFLADLKLKLKSSLPDHKQDIKMLYNDEVSDQEPYLSRFETAIWIKNEANICNRQFLESSTRAIRAHGSVVDYWPLEGDGQELAQQYDWVIDCRGAGAVNAKTFAQDEKHKLRLVRGEIFRVRTDKVKFTRPIRIIQGRFHIYVVPKPDNIFVVGASDLGDQGTGAVTVRSSLDLLTAIYALHPGFADAQIIEAIAGQRAVYDSREAEIVQHGNILCGNGLSRQGWMIGPMIVEQLLERIQAPNSSTLQMAN